MAEGNTKLAIKSIDDLRTEAGRSRIVTAAISHLEEDRGLKLSDPKTRSISWSLDFTLHISL